MSSARLGLLSGLLAYVLWGLFPLYWPLLEPAPAVEILGHRVVWSLLFVGLLLVATGGLRVLRGLDRRQLRLLAVAAVLITINWGTFIYAVNSGHVVEGSLGYFITPLVSVALAVVVLHERLRRRQQVAVALAAVAVAVLTIAYGRPPWIALALAGSFGTYGLVKNRAGVEGAPSFLVESAIVFLPALAYLVYLGATGDGTFTSEGAGHTALLVAAGVVTAVPLVLFGAAAIRIPLTTLGLLQYVNPGMQLVIGVVIDNEPMPPSRVAGFALVWLALVVFTTDAVGIARRRPQPAAV